MVIYHHIDDDPKDVMNSACSGREVVVVDDEGKTYMSILVPQEPLDVWKEKWEFLKGWIALSKRHTTAHLLAVMEEMEKSDG